MAQQHHHGTMETMRSRVLFCYAWLQKIVQSPYDVPVKEEQDQLLAMNRMGDLDKP
jgi:hypothetical protein